MNVTPFTVTQLVEGGVVARPVNRYMCAVAALSLSQPVCISTWRSRYLPGYTMLSLG